MSAHWCRKLTQNKGYLMNYNSLKKLGSVIALSLLISNYISAAKPQPKKNPRKAVKQNAAMPDNASLMASVVNRSFPGRQIADLPIKDVVLVFEQYIAYFASNAEPFAWDVRRLDIFTSVLNTRLDHVSLSSDFTHHQNYYSSEFGITSMTELKGALQTLIQGLKNLYAALYEPTNQTTRNVILSLNDFSQYLKKNLSSKLAQRIDNVNGNSFTLIAQISRRLSQQ